MAIKVSIDEQGEARQDLTPDQFVVMGTANRVFPLFTRQDMATRWGVSVQLVNNWSRRHTDFPKEMPGVMVQVGAWRGAYPFFEVERYEKTRGLEVATK